MKTSKYYCVMAILMTAAAFLAIWQIRTAASAEGKEVRLSLKTEKESYSIGEVIELGFEIVNTGREPMAIVKPSVYSGGLRLFISDDGKNYSEYVGPGWGSLDSSRKPVRIGAGENVAARATMLYNQRILTEHLTPLYADRIKKSVRIDSEFAILEPGHYWLKAAFTNGTDTYRSEAVEIEITQPVGSDAVVWEQLKMDGAFAYFLHTGDARFSPGSVEERAFNEKLRQIAMDYPGAEFTQKLEQNLQKYNRNVEDVKRARAERESAK